MSHIDIPHCPLCGSGEVKLDSLCEYDGSEGSWVHSSDCGDCYCSSCEGSFSEEQIVWSQPKDG